MKRTERLQIKMAELDRQLLETISEKLGLDMSSTIRFLVHEKSRALGVTVPSSPPAKKRRRTAG